MPGSMLEFFVFTQNISFLRWFVAYDSYRGGRAIQILFNVYLGS